MKKAIYYSLILSLTISTAFSQMPQVSVSWGPEQKGSTGKDDKEQSYVIGEDENGGLYSLRERYKYLNGQVLKVQRFIEHFDKNGKLTGSEKIIIRHQGGDRFFDGIFFNEGRMYLVTFHLRRSDKMNVLSVQDIDTRTLLVDENIRAVAEVPYERGLFGFVNMYSLKMVDDRIYVFHAAPEPGSGKTLVSIHVFDKDFKLQWKQFQSLPYQEKLFQAEDFDIDQNGTVRIMATIFKGKKIKLRQGEPNYEYHFFVFANEGKDYMEHSITLGDKHITDMRFSYRPGGDIACTGFYSDRNSQLRTTTTIAGAFYILVDPESTSITLENYMEFETAASMTYMSYSTSSTSYTQTTTTLTIKWINYQYDNIVVLKINPEGIIEWADIIPKKQHTASDGGMYSSFITAFIGEKIYLIYNDNPKNLNASPGEVYRFRKNKEAVVVCAEIDYQGNINKKALFSAGEAETLTCPMSSKQIADNRIEIYGKKGKKYKWGILEFN